MECHVAIGYTHMDIMEEIIANVHAYIVMGEFKSQLVHLFSSPGYTHWMKYHKESTDGVCDNYSDYGAVLPGAPTMWHPIVADLLYSLVNQS